jgi:hypothetical protein
MLFFGSSSRKITKNRNQEFFFLKKNKQYFVFGSKKSLFVCLSFKEREMERKLSSHCPLLPKKERIVN